jgi:hypothetical protein
VLRKRTGERGIFIDVGGVLTTTTKRPEMKNTAKCRLNVEIINALPDAVASLTMPVIDLGATTSLTKDFFTVDPWCEMTINGGVIQHIWCTMFRNGIACCP